MHWVCKMHFSSPLRTQNYISKIAHVNATHMQAKLASAAQSYTHTERLSEIKQWYDYNTHWVYQFLTVLIKIVFAFHLKHSSFLAFS